MTPEEESAVEKFQNNYSAKEADLRKVLNFLMDTLNLKMHQATKYDSAMEYFRGIDFHLLVLANE